jgi:putative sigma-54 modulation protein
MNKIRIESVHFSIDKKLAAFIEEKVEKLNQFFDQIIRTEVILKVERKESFDNKVVEISLHVPGKELFAKKQNDSFEAAVDETCEALRRQLRKHKGKLEEEISLK